MLESWSVIYFCDPFVYVIPFPTWFLQKFLENSGPYSYRAKRRGFVLAVGVVSSVHIDTPGD